MKTLHLLFAVACLVFHVHSTPIQENVQQDEPKNLDAVKDDGIGVEDVDVADDSDGQANPMVCSFSGGTCRHRHCNSNEVTGGMCYPGVVCCIRP